MASGDALLAFHPLGGEPPATLFATLDVRNQHPVLDFQDGTANEAMMWSGMLPEHYGGGGITATVVWAASTAGSGNTKWDGFFERNDDDSTTGALGTDSFATEQAVTAAAASVSGEVAYDDITFTDGSRRRGRIHLDLFHTITFDWSDKIAIIEHDAARFHTVDKLVIGGLRHGKQNIRVSSLWI